MSEDFSEQVGARGISQCDLATLVLSVPLRGRFISLSPELSSLCWASGVLSNRATFDEQVTRSSAGVNESCSTDVNRAMKA